MEEFDDMLRPVHEGVVDALAADHAAHRHRARGDALGKGDHVGDDAVALGREGMPEPVEAAVLKAVEFAKGRKSEMIEFIGRQYKMEREVSGAVYDALMDTLNPTLWLTDQEVQVELDRIAEQSKINLPGSRQMWRIFH